MSRRRIESGLNSQSSFSLRTLATSGPTAPAAVPVAGTARHNAAPPTIPQQASLSFKFDSLATRPTSAAASATSPTLRASAPAALPSNFFAKAATGNDSMRLTACVEDLTQRLRKAMDAKVQLESQVTRLNGALVQERSQTQQRLAALKTEVATVQDNEMRLRTELAQRPAVREVDTHKFATRVRSALEQEETNAKVADAEARLGALVKRADSLTAEVKLLESRKADALAATESALSQEEMDDLVAKAATAQAAAIEAEDRRMAIEDDIARFSAMRDVCQQETADAEAALLKANEATAAAVVDESAAKQQLREMLLEHGNVAEKVAYMEKQLEGLSTAAVAPTTFGVSGAHAPERNIEALGSPMAQVTAAGCCGDGVAYHFKHDAPLNICSIAPDPSATDATNQMVTALVSDLQAYFQSSAADHAKVGREHESPASVGAVESKA